MKKHFTHLLSIYLFKIFNTVTKKFIKKLNKNSVLHRACYKNNVALVALLLEHKADPNIKNHQGFEPIKYTQNPTIINKLVKSTTIIPLLIDFDNNTILHLASKYNKKEWAEQFLDGFNDKNLELSVKRLIAALNITSKTTIFIFVASLRRVATLKLKTKIPKNIILLFVFAHSKIKYCKIYLIWRIHPRKQL